MHRHALTDEQWAVVKPLLPRGRPGPKSKRGDRTFIDAVLYRVRTGVAWRDLPARFGPWKSIYNRFDNWSKRGVWAHVFKALQLEIDPSISIADASVVRAHQDSSGGRGGSTAMLWAALEEAFLPSSTRSSTAKRVRSTSRSRQGTATKP
jgi:transposase